MPTSEQNYFEQFIGDNGDDARPSKYGKWIVTCYGQVSVFDTFDEAREHYNTFPSSWNPHIYLLAGYIPHANV